MIIKKAIYVSSTLNIYAHNPFIEALPNYKDYNSIDIAKLLSEYPEHLNKNSCCKYDRAGWIFGLNNNLFIPLTRHIQLQQSLDFIIRQSYAQRKVQYDEEYLTNAYKRQKEAELEGKKIFDIKYNNSDVDPLSIAVIGCSGIGKSTAVSKILGLYPQVIHHDQVSKSIQSVDQVVYLKVQCPHASSVKTLCKDIIQELSNLTYNNYIDTLKLRKYQTLDSYKSILSHLLSLHKVGILVIDEIQNITSLRKNRDELFNFIVSLSNALQVSILYIGTPKISKFMQENLRVARRFGSCGAISWDRMLQNSTEWKRFIRELWKYNVLLEEDLDINNEVENILYECSQGIIDILIKLYSLSQIRAITANHERLSKNIILKVYDEYFNSIKPIVQAIKQNDYVKINQYADICISEDEYQSIGNLLIDQITNDIEDYDFNSKEYKRKEVIRFFKNAKVSLSEDLNLKLNELLDDKNNFNANEIILLLQNYRNELKNNEKKPSEITQETKNDDLLLSG